MPLVANAFRFSEAEGLKPGRLGRWMVLAVLLALVAGVLVTIYIQYNVGGTKYSWGANSVPKYPFDFLMRQLRRIGPGAVQPYAFNWSAISPNTNFLWATGVGLALVLTFSALRLRYTWWPFHPVVFLVWGSFAMAHMGPSFLLGWIIKSLVTRLGGSQAYRKAKTFFVGAIAGEFVAGVIWAAFGLIYYLNAGAPGPMFRVHP